MTVTNITELITDKKFKALLQLIKQDKTSVLSIPSAQFGILFRYLTSSGKLSQSKELGQLYLAQHGGDADINFLMGNCELRLGNTETARGYLQKSLDIRPDSILTQVNIALVHNKLADNDTAFRLLHDVLRVKPDYSFVHDKIGYYYCRMGCCKDGIRSFQRALQCAENKPSAFSKILFWRNYLEESTEELIFNEARLWGSQLKHEYKKGVGVFLNEIAPQKKLKIGFVSPDFCKHPVSFFVPALFKKLNRNRFSLFGYSDFEKPDEVTNLLSKQVDHFMHISKLDDQSLLKQINADQIDILFDLTGHTAKNRLSMFHLKAAPIQISWLGYPATTGCQGIDYRLTDKYADPVSESDSFYTEKLLRMDNGFLCYEPLERAPEIGPAPVNRNGYITFGSFNNLAKVSNQLVALWSRILSGVPNSKLLIKRKELKDPYTQSIFLQRFAKHGIGSDQLTFRTSQSKIEDHLNLYNQIDIALDTYPYNGTTTTLEALWMGVPVVTRSGHTHASRVGDSILKNAGFDELITKDSEAYLAVALELANRTDKLDAYRKTLRKSISTSNVVNQTKFANNFEKILTRVWKHWCEEQLAREIVEDAT